MNSYVSENIFQFEKKCVEMVVIYFWSNFIEKSWFSLEGTTLNFHFNLILEQHKEVFPEPKILSQIV